VEIAGPAVEDWADTVAGQHGFSEVSHTLELFGLCSDCASG
jgi:Fur family ferric uptake transcriptional regulator